MISTNTHTQPAKWGTHILFALLGILCWSEAAIARTAVQIDERLTLFFERGNFDPVTFSGIAYDVFLTDGRNVIWKADSIEIDARGDARGKDWFVNFYRSVNYEYETPEFHFINRAGVLRNFAFGRLNTGPAPSNEGLRAVFGDPASADSYSADSGVNTYTKTSSFHMDDTTFSFEYVDPDNPYDTESISIKVDTITTAPFVFTNSPAGERVIESMGLRFDGVGLGNQDQVSIGELDTLQLPSIDMSLRLRTRFVGRQMFTRFNFGASARGLGDLAVGLEIATSSDFFDVLMPLFEGDEDDSHLDLLAEVAAVNKGEVILVDKGLINFGLNALRDALAEDGHVHGTDRETMLFSLRLSINQILQDLFPSHASALIRPIEDMILNGGTLAVAIEPKQPVSFANLMSYAHAPDRAIDGLGVRVTHKR